MIAYNAQIYALRQFLSFNFTLIIQILLRYMQVEDSLNLYYLEESL